MYQFQYRSRNVLYKDHGKCTKKFHKAHVFLGSGVNYYSKDHIVDFNSLSFILGMK